MTATVPRTFANIFNWAIVFNRIFLNLVLNPRYSNKKVDLAPGQKR